MTVPHPAPPLHLPRRDSAAHKGDFGRVLVVGGSRGMAGSIAMTATSALRAGAGLVTAAIPDRCLETVAVFNPCVMTRPLADDPAGQFAAKAGEQLAEISSQPDAIAVGPGMGTAGGGRAVLQWVLTQQVPRVIDADGLNTLAAEPAWPQRLSQSQQASQPQRYSGPIVLTPHPGEWQRLSGSSAADRTAQQASARRLAAKSGAIILLKGAGTYVTDGQREYLNRTGNPGMASGGSGDCLTGIIATLLAQRLAAWDATILAAWIHGLAGDLAASEIGMAGMTALDLIAQIPAAVNAATLEAED
ncbi:NAD(P)H-hydrate dehydratase [Planctomycetaceae bacterium SH139]